MVLFNVCFLLSTALSIKNKATVVTIIPRSIIKYTPMTYCLILIPSEITKNKNIIGEFKFISKVYYIDT